MSHRAEETTELGDTSTIKEEARKLFARWAAEEESGYRGELSWEEFKRALNEERPAHSKPFHEG